MVVEAVVRDDERLERVRAAPAELTAATSQCPWKGTPSTLWPRTQTLAAVLLLFRRSQRLKKNGNSPKETTKGPRPEPDHLPEEHSESATRGSVASGALSSFLSATCETPCDLSRSRHGVLEEMCDGGSVKKETNKIN